MLPKECKAFQQYFDDIQQALESIAGMDDLLAGTFVYYAALFSIHSMSSLESDKHLRAGSSSTCTDACGSIILYNAVPTLSLMDKN